MAEKQPIDLSFPVKGLNENWAYKAQPEGTSPDCLNVRAYDTLGTRLRGGQRPGLSKFFSSQVNGTNPIQRLGFLIQSVTNIGTDVSETFTQSNGQLSGTDWTLLANLTSSTWTASATYPVVNTNAILHNNTTASGITYKIGAISKRARTGANYTLQATVTLAIGGTGSASRAEGGFIFRANDSTVPFNTASSSSATATFASFSIYASGYTVTVGDTMTFHSLGGSTYGTVAWWTTPRTLKLVITGDTYVFTADTETLLSGTFDSDYIAPAGNEYVGFMARKGTDTANSVTLDTWSVENTSPSLSRRKPTLLAVSAGDIYSGDPTDALALATGGNDALETDTDAVKMTTLFTKAYFVDGTNYKVFDNATDTVSAWEATSGVLPAGAALTTYSLTAATPATPSFTVQEDLSALADGDYIEITGSTANDGIYTVASTSGSGPTVITVDQAVPDDTVDGVLGQTLTRCRLIASYRGRIVMAGLSTDPQNWFMSAAGDPLDWDYGATASATMAVAGNNTSAGKCPDVITCLASLNDDLLIIGGDHTLWLMRGDPADGGRIDNISQQMGISGADAYCFDPNGTFYFFGNGALWRMIPGQTPEAISRNRLDKTFGAINLSTNTIKLVWDQTNHGIHIFIIPSVQGSTTHYWWDARIDSFWPDQYPAVQGPTAIMVYDADSPSDRAVLLGGWGGYIRQEDASAVSDDSTTILSRVKTAPITPGGVHKNVRINRVTTILGQTSDSVVLYAYAGQSPEEVVSETTPAWSYSVSTINRYAIPRVSGNSLLFEIENDSFADAWVAQTVYAVDDQVVNSGTPYVCLEAHTGGTFSTDLLAEKWVASTFRTWAIESLSLVLDVTGRTRHGRI